MMSLACKVFIATSILALAISAFGRESQAQRANAATRSALEAPHVLLARDQADRSPDASARGSIERKIPLTPARASSEPLFLSDEYMKIEKQTEDRLRRVMTICKGC